MTGRGAGVTFRPAMSKDLAYLYVHLPFCEVICHYCDFYTVRAKDARQEDFFAALTAEAKAQFPSLAPRLKAIYLGGGTPSASPPELIERFLDLFRDRISADTEITLEANPTNINATLVTAWKKAGIKRISLGIQSLDDSMLKKLGRVHSGEQAISALRMCLAEFENVTGDLIYGVPGQAEEQPAEHAGIMAGLGLKHISAYNLTLEPTHFLHPKLPDDVFSWKQIQKLAETLEARGFRHYEISNFGMPGFESRNNKNYWAGGGYLALGPSAHGFDGAFTRWRNIADWEKYIRLANLGESVREEVEELTLEQRRIETIFTSLRTAEGLEISKFAEKFGQNLLENPAIKECEKSGLGRVTNGSFVLTFSGRMLGDEIARKLL